jgi:hypothetical protein
VYGVIKPAKPDALPNKSEVLSPTKAKVAVDGVLSKTLYHLDNFETMVVI